jgi:diadenosine tetraphosphatase ApaH/serine/threonine PP2A family protein phosphatase
MRILVVTDVHSNQAALEAVLASAGPYDQLWSLGDVVGYGPDPNECILMLTQHDHIVIPGNHDWGVLGNIDLDDFNTEARKANLWTRSVLSPESTAYLEKAPQTVVQGEVTLAHGSPRHPIWEYITRTDTAQQNYAHFTTRICLVGHTHIPAIYWQPEPDSPCIAIQPKTDQPYSCEQGRYIINPGSVGQPRDGDPRAAYLVYDSESCSFEHRRVAYDIKVTQKKMRSVALSARNIARLEFGL